MLFLAFLFGLHQGDSDFYGVYYEDNEKTILKKAPVNLIKYEIPSSTKIIRGGKIDYGPFYECIDTLKQLTFQKNSELILIEPYGLAKLKVESIDLSPCTKLKELGYSSFRFCNAETLILPPNINTIKSGALYSMPKIKILKFPDSLNSLGGWTSEHVCVLGYSERLTTILWGENPSIETIGSDCFKFTGLTSFRIPKTLKSIGISCFLGCAISNFSVDDENAKFSSDAGVLFDKNKTTIIYFSKALNGIYKTPDTISRIYSCSFGCSNLTSVILSSSVNILQRLAFRDSYIEYITIPQTVTCIEDSCFYSCKSLKKINFNPNINTLEEKMFFKCINLEEIILPNEIECIQEKAFFGCKNVNLIVIPSSVKILEKSIFADINETAEIIFGDGSPFMRHENIIYSKGKKRLVSFVGPGSDLDITILSTVEVIGGSAFAEKSIRRIMFEPQSICQTIEESAFEGCGGSFSISLPDSIKEIGDAAFKNSKLSSVSFGGGLNNINSSAFYGTKIASVSFPSHLKSLGESAFQGCLSLSNVDFSKSSIEYIGSKCFASTIIYSVQIPSTVLSIGEDAFAESSLSVLSFSLPAISTIGTKAFSKCKSLSVLVLESGTQYIGRWAFSECTDLSQVLISPTVKTIGDNAFEDCIQLTKVNILPGSSLSFIDPLAFIGCSRLKQFIIPDDNTNFKSANGLVTDINEITILMHLPGHEETTCIVPPTVKIVSDHAFQGSFYLEYISFEECNNVDIKYQGFYGCHKLKKIILGDAIKSIASDSFGDCPLLSCDSIIHDPSLRSMLKLCGLSPDVFLPCPTLKFTPIDSQSPVSTSAVITVVLLSEEINSFTKSEGGK